MDITLFKNRSLIAAALSIASALPAAAATFVVTNAHDNGAGSLRAAMEQANANGEADTITFDAAFFSQPRTISLTSGEIIMTKDGGTQGDPDREVTIEGPGANLLTISGNNSSRIIDVANGALDLRGVTLRDGNGVGVSNSGRGGAIFVSAGALTVRQSVLTGNGGSAAIDAYVQRLTIENSVLTNNDARGLVVTAFSSDTPYILTNTTISNNTTDRDIGGALLNRGITTISHCSFTGNHAQDSVGGLKLVGGTATVTDTIFADNVATGEGAGLYLLSGVYVLRRVTVDHNIITSTATAGGGGIRISGADVDIIDSTISNNQITNGMFNDGGGGGGLFSGSSDTVNIINSTFFGNKAGERGVGGGIKTVGPGPLNVINCTIVGNIAVYDGGGTAGYTGGGIFSDDILGNGLTNIQNTIVANNTAPGNPDVGGSFVSAGYNIIGQVGGASGFGATGDQLNVDPLVDPAGLQDNGGLTLTVALQANSPAIDQGKSVDVMMDQRSLPRPYDHPAIANATGGDGSDIGAFEDQPPNTLPGGNVSVTGPGGTVTVTFHSITQGGYTTFSVIEIPSAAGTPPEGYTISADTFAYDITSTATYTTPITVAFTLPYDTSEADFDRIRILHLENGELVDRTILPPDDPSPNFETRTVYAEVDSLSPFVVAMAPNPPTLLNISTRANVLTGDNVLIGGFIVTGNAPKKVLLRAIGPSLTPFGVSDALADPVLELHKPDGTVVTNDNWKDTQESEIEATNIAPSNNLESAILVTLDPVDPAVPGSGAYTAIVKGTNDGTGVALVEAYDLDEGADSQLANISTRGFVQGGDNVMIGGVIIGSTSDVLVRAIGPELTQYGISNALEDTTLELHDRDGALITSNDDWKDSQQTEIEATGIPPSDDRESAVLMTLQPSSYTAIVRGKNNTTGVALVEVYKIAP